MSNILIAVLLSSAIDTYARVNEVEIHHSDDFTTLFLLALTVGLVLDIKRLLSSN